MVGVMGLRNLYYVGHGATASLDSMFMCDGDGRKSEETNSDHMESHPRGIGRQNDIFHFCKEWVKWNRHSAQFILCEFMKISTHGVYTHSEIDVLISISAKNPEAPYTTRHFYGPFRSC